MPRLALICRLVPSLAILALLQASPAAAETLRVGKSTLSSFSYTLLEVGMQTEFRIVSRIIKGRDFYEGVRAVIVDKDNAPRWQPATLATVSDAEVARHFAPLGDDEWTAPEPERR